jgi:hypothetical protein
MMADRARIKNETPSSMVESSPISNTESLWSKSKLDSYRLRRGNASSNELESQFVKDDYSLTQRKFGQGGKVFKNLIPKDYLMMKRKSRDVTNMGMI